MNLYVDCDYITYKVGFACQTVQEDGLVTTEPLPFALATVKRSLNNLETTIRSMGHVGSVTYFLTGRDNFRTAIYEDYKANRVSEKPVLYHSIREYLVKKRGAVVVNGMEADDACSLAASRDPDAVIISNDKDLLTVPGWHYNPGKPEEGLRYITDTEALRFFYTQLLMGDRTDNIPGCGSIHPVIKRAFKLKAKTFGQKSAEKVMESYDCPKRMLQVVQRCYNYVDNPHLVRNAQLLHMTRELDADGEPVLWQLPV